jgi:hypothetical protein
MICTLRSAVVGDDQQWFTCWLNKDDPAQYTEWATWMTQNDRRVDRTDVTARIKVTTMFMGIDMNNDPDLDRAPYETRIWGGLLDGWATVSVSMEDARACHARMLIAVRDKEGLSGASKRRHNARWDF